MVDVEALLRDAGEQDKLIKCHTCRWLRERPTDEQERWTASMRSARFTNPQLARAMAMVPDVEINPPTEASIIHHKTGRHWER